MRLAMTRWVGIGFALVLASPVHAAPTTKNPHGAPTVQVSTPSKQIFDAAVSAQKKGDAAAAANAFARYIADPASDPTLRARAVKALAKLSPKLGRLSIDAPGASSLTIDAQPLDAPLLEVVYVKPGTHTVEARFADEAVLEAPNTVAGEEVRVSLVPPPKPAEVAPTPEPPPQKAVRTKPLPPVVVYVGAGVTVAAGVLTILSGLDTESQKTKFDGEPSQQNLDSGKSRQLRTNVLLGVTGGLALLTGAAALWGVEWKRRDVNAKVGFGPASVVLRGEF